MSSEPQPVTQHGINEQRIHYVLSTHWDREWYKTYQAFRYQLVQLFDQVLAGFQRGEMKGPFTCDGQVIILEDYLEVRGEKKAELRALMREGKLVAGPWYVLPDEFLVSGESLIRNLELGALRCRSFGGEPSRAGFVCDLFGHTSQMPQIFHGFGINSAFVWRGTNLPDIRWFIWEGADGTQVPTYRFKGQGYCTYAKEVRRMREFATPFDSERAAGDLERYVTEEKSGCPDLPVLLFDGGDHLPWDPQYYSVLAARVSAEASGQWQHSTLDAYVADVLNSAPHQFDTVICGELREPGRTPNSIDEQWLIPGVLSSRVWIKQWNYRCETLLCDWAEPFSAISSALNKGEYPLEFLQIAWNWLIQNHPHDSICGCSIDAVHEQMKFRFGQTEDIARTLIDVAVNEIAAAVCVDTDEGSRSILIFNPVPRRTSGVIEIPVELPLDWPSFREFFGYEALPAFTVHDSEGRNIPYQRVRHSGPHCHTESNPMKFPQISQVNRVTIACALELPALGYLTLTLRPIPNGEHFRHPSTPCIGRPNGVLENEFLVVTVTSGGAVAIRDKRNNAEYTNLLVYEDVADIGDGWYYGPPVNDRRHFSLGAPHSVNLLNNGIFQGELELRHSWSLPRAWDASKARRSEDLVSLNITTLIRLARDSDHIVVETRVDNCVKDHRIRVLLQSDAQTDTYLSDAAFDVVERKIALDPDRHLYRELEMETRPQRSWSAIWDGNRGLAVVAEGLHESGVLDEPERPLAMTLYRSTGRTFISDGEPGGQLLSTLNFKYLVMPLASSPDPVRLAELAQRNAAGYRFVTRSKSADTAASRPQLSARGEFLRVDGNAILTSLRRTSGKDFLIRVYNPTDAQQDITLSESHPWLLAEAAGIHLVSLSGAIGEAVERQGGMIRLSLKAREILTICINQDPQVCSS